MKRRSHMLPALVLLALALAPIDYAAAQRQGDAEAASAAHAALSPAEWGAIQNTIGEQLAARSAAGERDITGKQLLDQFRASSTHLVFVIDEYGEVLGMGTLYDVLESVTGEFQPHGHEEPWAVQREDGSWLLDGLMPAPELQDRLAMKQLPEEGSYHTLSGMLTVLLGRLPQTADRADWEGWRFEVVDMDGRRVDKVLAQRQSNQ